MKDFSEFSFEIQPIPQLKTKSLRLLVNGVDFADQITAYEESLNYHPAGGYGGLIPDFFNYGHLTDYLLGRTHQDSYFSDLGRIYLLGCDCGEVGCWPILGSVIASDQHVVWRDFLQPHRPDRDYSGFGPFFFDLNDYRQKAEMISQRFQR